MGLSTYRPKAKGPLGGGRPCRKAENLWSAAVNQSINQTLNRSYKPSSLSPCSTATTSIDAIVPLTHCWRTPCVAIAPTSCLASRCYRHNPVRWSTCGVLSARKETQRALSFVLLARHPGPTSQSIVLKFPDKYGSADNLDSASIAMFPNKV